MLEMNRPVSCMHWYAEGEIKPPIDVITEKVEDGLEAEDALEVIQILAPMDFAKNAVNCCSV